MALASKVRPPKRPTQVCELLRTVKSIEELRRVLKVIERSSRFVVIEKRDGWEVWHPRYLVADIVIEHSKVKIYANLNRWFGGYSPHLINEFPMR